MCVCANYIKEISELSNKSIVGFIIFGFVGLLSLIGSIILIRDMIKNPNRILP